MFKNIISIQAYSDISLIDPNDISCFNHEGSHKFVYYFNGITIWEPVAQVIVRDYFHAVKSRTSWDSRNYGYEEFFLLGIQRNVVRWKSTDISGENVAFIFWV
jgi:hypothetical protein